MLNKGTSSLIVAKCVTTTIAIAHPTSAAHAKVHALKRNVATIVLVDAEFDLCSSGLAIWGKVQVGHSFEPYRLAKQIVEQHSGRRSIRQTPLFSSSGVHLEGAEAKVEESCAFLE